MGYLQGMDAGLRSIRGGFASSWGQTYDIYRVGAGVSGSYLDGDPILTGWNYSPNARAKKTQIEGQTFEMPIYGGEIDDTSLQLFDILVENGYGAEEETFVLAQQRPLHKPLFVQCPFNITITRPQPHGGQMAQQPTGNQGPAIAGAGYGGVDKASEWGLILTNGVYSFVNSQSDLATVPAALLQTNRIQDSREPKIPAALYRERFCIWIPLLPGVQLQEQDAFNFPNSDRYEGASIYTPESVGLAGYFIFTEKLGT